MSRCLQGVLCDWHRYHHHVIASCWIVVVTSWLSLLRSCHYSVTMSLGNNVGGCLPYCQQQCAVLYTPTVCPMDSNGLPSNPAISIGPSGQSIGSLSESIGHDWIPLLVQAKSSESLLKPLRSKKWLD